MKVRSLILILICCIAILLLVLYFHSLNLARTTDDNQSSVNNLNVSSTSKSEVGCDINSVISKDKPLSYLINQVGQYPELDTFVNVEPLKTRLQNLLKDRFQVLKNYWHVKGQLSQQFSYLTVDVCAVHQCNDISFIIVFDVNNDNIIVKYKNKDDDQIFSEKDSGLPSCLDLSHNSTIANASYDDIVNNVDKYKGMMVRWKGIISNLSQIDGIKFWIVDENHKIDISNIPTSGYTPWFWYIPGDFDAEQFNKGENAKYDGSWVKYMFAISSQLDYDQMKNGQVYYVTGVVEGIDCTFYDYSTYNKKICVPNLSARSIEVDK